MKMSIDFGTKAEYRSFFILLSPQSVIYLNVY